MNHIKLLNNLKVIVGTQFVSTIDEDLERHSFDAITSVRLSQDQRLISARVQAVVRPASTSEVSEIVKVVSRARIPIIPYGGGTGIMGGVIPIHGGISLDLSRMARVLEIDHGNRMAIVQPAVTLANLDQAARRKDLMLGHDPWSTPIATVGGAISTDSIGYLAAKYGSMGQQVRALEIVTPDGNITRTKPLLRQSSGPQINGIFIGSEGTMGIITEASIQLFHIPESEMFVTIGFETFEVGYPVVVNLFNMGLHPALLDLTEEEAFDGTSGFQCLLYMRMEGYTEEVQAQANRAITESLALGGHNLGPDLAEAYWENRHTVAERWKNTVQPLRPTERWTKSDHPNSDYLHLSLPITEVLVYKKFAEELVRHNGMEIREAAVWTNPELFSLIISDFAGSDRSKLNKVVAALLDMAIKVGGGIEYCHGIGMKLEPWAVVEWEQGLSAARSLKKAFDPKAIMNPGKLGL